MTRGRKLIPLIAAVVLALDPARAFSGSFYDINFTSLGPVGSGAENLMAWRISVVNTTGDPGYNPTTFDGISGYHFGIAGVLHQQYSPFFAPSTPTVDMAAYADSTDTHFLIAPGNIQAATIAPIEDIGLAASSEPPNAPVPFNTYGETSFGTTLTGAFTIADQGATWNLAQVVTPGGGYWHWNFYVGGAAGGESFYDIYPPPGNMRLDAGGAYTLAPGQSLTLDASGSQDSLGGTDLTFQWDLDGDGVYETDAGGSAVFEVSWAYLAGLGLDAVGDHDLRLRAIDQTGAYTNGYPWPEIWYSTLTVVPEPATMVLLSLGSLALLRARRTRLACRP